jgi:Tfp pilus assembly protein PilX
VAFHGTESALRVGESWLAGILVEPWPPQTSLGGSGVWQFQWAGDLASQDDYWWMSNGIEYGTSGTKDISEAATDPYYVIEYRSFEPYSENIEGYGPGPGNTYYRVSARGHGATTRSTALFQSHFTVQWN